MMRDDRPYTLYSHESPEGKFYYGVTSMPPKQRWNKGKQYKHNIPFTNDIQTFGWDNFTHIIIATGLSKGEAIDAERELINEANSKNIPCYNVIQGSFSDPEKRKAHQRKLCNVAQQRMFERHPEKKLLYIYRWRDSHKERVQAYRKEYEHRKEVIARRKANYKKRIQAETPEQREKRLAYMAEYRATHSEYYFNYNRSEKRREAHRIAERERRARKKTQTGDGL